MTHSTYLAHKYAAFFTEQRTIRGAHCMEPPVIAFDMPHPHTAWIVGVFALFALLMVAVFSPALSGLSLMRKRRSGTNPFRIGSGSAVHCKKRDL